MTFPSPAHQGFVHRGAPSLYPATEREDSNSLIISYLILRSARFISFQIMYYRRFRIMRLKSQSVQKTFTSLKFSLSQARFLSATMLLKSTIIAHTGDEKPTPVRAVWIPFVKRPWTTAVTYGEKVSNRLIKI